jgi:hypothetical protein
MEEINGKGMRTKGQAVGERERRREKGGGTDIVVVSIERRIQHNLE